MRGRAWYGMPPMLLVLAWARKWACVWQVWPAKASAPLHAARLCCNHLLRCLRHCQQVRPGHCPAASSRSSRSPSSAPPADEAAAAAAGLRPAGASSMSRRAAPSACALYASLPYTVHQSRTRSAPIIEPLNAPPPPAAAAVYPAPAQPALHMHDIRSAWSAGYPP